MGDSETVDPDALRTLARQLDAQLTPIVEAALTAFEQSEVSGPGFSFYGMELAMTYPGTQHFAMRDLQTKAEALQSIITRLNNTADTWDTAESYSTVQGH